MASRPRFCLNRAPMEEKSLQSFDGTRIV